MDLINNRYRVIKLLNQNNLVSIYLVSDMQKENKTMQLHILNSEYIPKSLIHFYANQFIHFRKITCKYISKNFSFNRISYIDNKPQTGEQFYFTSEYISTTEDLFTYIKNMNLAKTLGIFIDLCKAVNYLHLKGFIHGSLNADMVMIAEQYQGKKLMLKDLATVELEKYYPSGNTKSDTYYPSSVKKTDMKSDIYSLGLLLLTLIKKEPLISCPSEELKNLNKHINRDDEGLFQLLYPILKKFLIIGEKNPYNNLHDFILDLNKRLETDYSIVQKEEIEILHFHTELIGRKTATNKIFESYEKMITYQPRKRIFLVQGDTGTGKTRFLKELKFLFELEKAAVYPSFSLNSFEDSSKLMWMDILRKIIIDTDNKTVEKYGTELMEYFPELIDPETIGPLPNFKKKNSIYRLVNRITGFIRASIKNKSAIIMIDNIHHADEFTINTLDYLCSEFLENSDLLLVLSYKDNQDFQNKDFIQKLKKRQDSESLMMKPLTSEQSGKMLKNILSLPFTPVKLTNRIFSQSYGNPLFIREIIKDLYSRNVIYIHHETGRWNIDLPEAQSYNSLEIPGSIEQALFNQLKDIDLNSMHVLSAISVFSNPVSVDMIGDLSGLREDIIESILYDLARKGILNRLISDSSYLYGFSNKVLRNIVYNKMSAGLKAEKHKKAAAILEMESDISKVTNLDELILHHELAGNKARCKHCYLENAKRMRNQKNFTSEISNLEKALPLMESNAERTELLLQIGALYAETNDPKLALGYLKEAEYLSITASHIPDTMYTYINLANVYSFLFDEEKTMEYLEKTKEILAVHYDLETYLEYKRIHSVLLVDKNKVDEAAGLLQEIIDECGEKYPKVKGNATRQLAFIYVYKNRVKKALKLYNEAIKLLEKADYTRGILVALNNVGSIYHDFYEDTETAMKYYVKVRDLGEEYGISTSEVYGLTNIAEIFHQKHKFEMAYKHYNHALKKAKKFNFIDQVYYLYNSLVSVSLKMNKYRKAFHYYSLVEKELEKNPNKGVDIVNFYETSAELFQSVGDYPAAEEFNQKVIEFHKDRDNVESDTALAYQIINRLRSPDIIDDDYDAYVKKLLRIVSRFPNRELKISTLSTAAVSLKMNKFRKAKQILSRAEKIITEETPEGILAQYFYALGAAEKSTSAVTFLTTGYEYAKRSNCIDLVAKITKELGDYYLANENYFTAANYYLESCEIIKTIVSEIPDDYKMNFINGNSLAGGFYGLRRIRYLNSLLLAEKKIDLTSLKSKVNSLAEVEDVMNTDEVKNFLKNKSFMKYISSQHMKLLSKDIHSKADILMNVKGDTTKNLRMIINYLAGLTIATRGLIIMEGQHQALTVIASTDNHNRLPEDLFIFNQVRSSRQPILLKEGPRNHHVDGNTLQKNTSKVLCFPISTNDVQANVKETSVLLGYIYLETDKIVNHFNEKGLRQTEELTNFLALLIEKYQLKLYASVDKLTGALSRKYLEDTLNDIMDHSRENSQIFSIIMFDLDGFKKVNDRYGHQTGDEVLRKVSGAIKDNLDQRYLLGRYGGEEFIIILPYANAEKAFSIAETLREKVKSQKILGDRQPVTISMGISSYPEHAQTVSGLIEKADQALYIAKESGKNKCQLWESDYASTAKPVNKLSGFLSGDELKDSRNIWALTELIQLTNKKMSGKEKVHYFLGRMIEIIEAQYGYFLLTDKNKIIASYGRKAHEENWLTNFSLNQKIIEKVIENEKGMYMMNWNDINRAKIVNGVPEWDSFLAVPIMKYDTMKGIIYLSAPARKKEFGADELNIISVFSDLAAIISDGVNIN